MLGVKRLEEKIAETKDPTARKELQDLLDKRKKEEKQILIVIIVFAVIWVICRIFGAIDKVRYDREMGRIKLEQFKLEQQEKQQRYLFELKQHGLEQQEERERWLWEQQQLNR